MTTRAKIITTVLLLVAVASVGAADYYFAGREYAANLLGTDTGTGSGVAKAEGPNVEAVAKEIQIETQASEDLTFLAQVAKEQPVRTFVLLKNGDRIGTVSYADGGTVKQLFIELKEALLSAFSDKVTELSDKTLQDAGLPVRNILTFRDPALSEEKLTFIRVRERLYEFHSATSAETAMQQYIDALSVR